MQLTVRRSAMVAIGRGCACPGTPAGARQRQAASHARGSACIREAKEARVLPVLVTPAKKASKALLRRSPKWRRGPWWNSEAAASPAPLAPDLQTTGIA